MSINPVPKRPLTPQDPSTELAAKRVKSDEASPATQLDGNDTGTQSDRKYWAQPSTYGSPSSPGSWMEDPDQFSPSPPAPLPVGLSARIVDALNASPNAASAAISEEAMTALRFDPRIYITETSAQTSPAGVVLHLANCLEQLLGEEDGPLDEKSRLKMAGVLGAVETYADALGQTGMRESLKTMRTDDKEQLLALGAHLTQLGRYLRGSSEGDDELVEAPRLSTVLRCHYERILDSGNATRQATQVHALAAFLGSTAPGEHEALKRACIHHARHDGPLQAVIDALSHTIRQQDACAVNCGLNASPATADAMRHAPDDSLAATAIAAGQHNLGPNLAHPANAGILNRQAYQYAQLIKDAGTPYVMSADKIAVVIACYLSDPTATTANVVARSKLDESRVGKVRGSLRNYIATSLSEVALGNLVACALQSTDAADYKKSSARMLDRRLPNPLAWSAWKEMERNHNQKFSNGSPDATLEFLEKVKRRDVSLLQLIPADHEFSGVLYAHLFQTSPSYCKSIFDARNDFLDVRRAAGLTTAPGAPAPTDVRIA